MKSFYNGVLVKMNQSNFQLQQAIKALWELLRPKIKMVNEPNGRSLEVRIKSQRIRIPIEENKPYRKTTGSFR